jgi:ribosomal protein L11 methyltransferase
MVVSAASHPLSETAAARLADRLADWDACRAVDVWEAGSGLWQVVAYFAAAPETAALEEIAQAAGVAGPDWRIAALPDADWVAVSQTALPPVRLGHLLVHGRHARAARHANDIAIEIEAAEAFGTGHHGTTAGCLAAMAALGRARRFRNVLDLGTGSGVLAIAAAKLWHASVLASDIDPRAVAIAAANARANSVGRYVTSVAAEGFQHRAFEERAPFDLIVANILARPLAELAPAFAHHLAPGGFAVLSGLLPDQQRMIVAAYRNQGLRLGRAAIRDGWLTLTLHNRQ